MTGPSSAAPLAGLTILVVEDDYLIAMDVEGLLGDLGATVVGPVGSQQEAVDLAASGDFDVALLDVNLRGDDVAPVAATLTARSIPFAFATGYGPEMLPAGFRDRPVLRKPFDRGAVGRVLSALRGEGDRQG